MSHFFNCDFNQTLVMMLAIFALISFWSFQTSFFNSVLLVDPNAQLIILMTGFELKTSYTYLYDHLCHDQLDKIWVNFAKEAKF